ASEGVEHADRESRHVVDEELVDVLGRDDQRHVGRCVVEGVGELAVAGIEGRDLARVAQRAGVDDVGEMGGRKTETELRHAASPPKPLALTAAGKDSGLRPCSMYKR